MSDPKDRRQAPRAPERVPLSITDGGRDLQVETKDLSASGACCVLSQFIPLMTKVTLRLEVQNGTTRVSIRCTGVIVRIEPIGTPEAPRYNMAVFFTDLSDQDRGAISRFIRERLSASAQRN